MITIITPGLLRTWHDTNNMEPVASKWEHVRRSTRIYVASKCRQPWQEIRDVEKSQPFIIFPKSVEEMNMDALRREGEGNSGADEVPEGCVWTVPELYSWACARVRGLSRTHAGNACKTQIVARTRNHTRKETDLLGVPHLYTASHAKAKCDEF